MREKESRGVVVPVLNSQLVLESTALASNTAPYCGLKYTEYSPS